MKIRYTERPALYNKYNNIATNIITQYAESIQLNLIHYLWFATVAFFITIDHIIATDRFLVNVTCFGRISKAVSSPTENKVLKIISTAGAEIPGSTGKHNITFLL